MEKKDWGIAGRTPGLVLPSAVAARWTTNLGMRRASEAAMQLHQHIRCPTQFCRSSEVQLSQQHLSNSARVGLISQGPSALMPYIAVIAFFHNQ